MASIIAVVGFSYFFGLFSALLLGRGGFLWAAAAFGLLFLISLFFVKKVKLVVLSLGAVTVSLLSLWGAEALWSAPAELAGTVCEAEGTVEGLEVNGARYTYTLSSCRVPGLKPFKTQLNTWQPLAVSAGERLRVRAEFQALPGEYALNEKSRLAAKGIFVTCEMEGGAYEVFESKPFAYYRQKAAAFFSDILQRWIPLDAAHLTQAMLLGDRSRLGDEVTGNYRTAGVSHLLVVSGMHLTILMGVFTRLLSGRRLPEWLRAALLLAVVFLFAAVTGFGASVLRAGIMASVMIVAGAAGRSGDSLSSLGLAVLLLCVQNPFAAADVGFILSVSATLGIVLFSHRIYAFIRVKPFKGRVFSFLLENIAVSAAAMVFVTPISMYIFGSYSLFAILSTAVLMVPSTLIVELGLVLCLLGGFLGPLLYPAAALLGLACRFSLWYASVIPGWSLLYAGEYSFFAAAGICVMMLIVFLSGKKRVRFAGIACCAAVITAAVAANMADAENVELTVYRDMENYSVVLAHEGSRLRFSTRKSGTAYDFSEELDLNLGDAAVHTGATPNLIEITAYGKTVVLENGGSLHEPFSADVLITKQPDGTIASPLILCDSVQRQAGNYVKDSLRLRITKSGEILLRSL